MSLNLAVLLRESAKLYESDESRVALSLGDTELTYAQLHAYVRRFAGALEHLGIDRGQNVALLLPNVPHFTIAYFGCHYAGAAVVPLNVLLTADEIVHHLDDSDAVALVTWEALYPQARAAVDRVDRCRHLIVAKPDGGDVAAEPGTHNMTALIGSADPVDDLPATMPDDTAVILYTSGTTGRPKGAELTHFNMFFNAHYAGTQLMDLGPDTVALATLPLFHSFGQTCIQNATIGVGGKVVLLPRFEPEAALELMSRHRVTYFAGVPTMYFALLHCPAASEYDLSALQWCLCGGAPMPVEVMNAFDSKYGVSILEGYGLSETSPVASFNVIDRPKKVGSIGQPIRGVEFKLTDAEGRTIETADVPGEIWIKGHNVMKGYYGRADATAEAIRDGWFRTGDVARRDADGYYFIVDRIKDMIIRGGFNVYPREIEEVLYGHPAVAEAAVIGVPHERHGEEVKAVLALKSGATASADEIVAYCKERLAAYKYPRIVQFVDALPKGPTGKILKRALDR
jgi:long-chain acyl-CoA synthetase